MRHIHRVRHKRYVALTSVLAVSMVGFVQASDAVNGSLTPDHLTSTSDENLLGLGGGLPALRQGIAAAAEPRIETSTRSRPVAPGVTLRSFDRYGPDAYSGTPNWLQADSLSVDLSKGTSVDYLFPGKVAAGKPISAQAHDTGAVAAVNGDFFDINNSNAPLGVGIKGGELIQSPNITDTTWHKSVATVTPEGIGAIGEVFFEGSISLPDGTSAPIAGVNKPTLSVDGIEAFTPLWGTYCRCRATTGAPRVTEVEVVGDKVTAVRTAAGEGEVPAVGFTLVGREAGADRLAGLKVGDSVSIAYQARGAEGARIQAAINGRQLLVVNGEVQKASAGNNVPPAPRTAIGFSRDGRTMYLLTADGRQPAFSDGLGLDELGQMMVELGAYNALNLDGGGSTTILARKPGGSSALLENVPSDGQERNDPNGLALFAPKGSGRLAGLWVETLLDPQRASGSSRIAPAPTARVFPGLSRKLTAAGYDEAYNPAPSNPSWRSSSIARGTISSNGVFHARLPGSVTATATSGTVSGKVGLTVLQPLARLSASAAQIALTKEGEKATVGIVGYDRAGSSAPFEASEIVFSYDKELLDITPTETGQFAITAKKASGSSLVNISVGRVKMVLPVTVGLDEVVVSDFEDASKWQFFGERAAGTVSSAEGKVGKGLRLTYDFTTSTEIRTGGAVPTPGITIPGQPRALRLWVNAKNDGEWASMQVYDADGQLLPAFRAGYLTYTGWKQLEFAIPSGTRYPVKLRRYYSAETRATAKYQGDVVIDELTALIPPSIDVPPSATVEDPLVVQDGNVSGADWRFAVMSDAQFVGRDPSSEQVVKARRTLQEIRAQKPDFLLINGDLVDEGAPDDFALAKKILDEELDGTLRYYYVPGNHERAAGKLDNFRAEFGETQQTFDHRGTRFITFDSSGISYKASDWTQLRRLRAELDRAAADPSVGSVVVVQHVPPRDPTPAKASELSDRKEADTLEQWLASFRATSGKGAALIGAHVGTFYASRVDGIPQFINGNSGKNPSTGPSEGGFTGWSLWGVEPVSFDEAKAVRANPVLDGPRWLTSEVRPHVDGLELSAPASVRVGASADVLATVVQQPPSGPRRVPVDFPVSADWSGSSNVHVGSAFGLQPSHVAWLDPSTGKVIAFRPARIELAVTVNGVTTKAAVTITR